MISHDGNARAARLSASRPLFAHAGWPFDAYPEIPQLLAHGSITVAEFEGPGMIDHIQMTQNWFMNGLDSPDEADLTRQKAIAARGVILEIYYNGAATPSVRVPAGDFFGDASAGLASNFASAYLAKVPGAHHAWFPIPFERSLRIVLVNETEYDYMSNTIVEGHTLPEWDPSLAYFHATWDRDLFQATPDTERELIRIDGPGHLLGRSWSLATDEPDFTQFGWIIEANNEFRIDGETDPSVVYVGSEDSFGFCFGFAAEFAGPQNGIVYLGSSPERLGTYRFWDPEPLRFQESLEVRLTWKHEKMAGIEYLEHLRDLAGQDRLWVDYATTTYWYQATPGFEHRPLLAIEDRITPLLAPRREA